MDYNTLQCNCCKSFIKIEDITKECKSNIRDEAGGRRFVDYNGQMPEACYYGSHQVNFPDKKSRIKEFIRYTIKIGMLLYLFRDGVPTSQEVWDQWWILAILGITGFV